MNGYIASRNIVRWIQLVTKVAISCGVQAELRREKDDHYGREDTARAQLQSVIFDLLQAYLSPLQAVTSDTACASSSRLLNRRLVCNAATVKASTHELAEPEAVRSKLKTQQVPMSSSVQGYASILHLHPGC